jgi:arylsulfatase A-like enzyme
MSDAKPNIVFFFTDDQRWDTLAAVNNPQIRTPNLDALAAAGTVFSRAHIMGGSSGAVCMPSRAMLHTGRTLYHIHDRGQRIADDHVLLGEHLQAAGYQTFGTGKWHNSPESFNRAFSDGGAIFFGGMNDHWKVPACDYHADGNYPDPKFLRARWGQRIVEGDQVYDWIDEGKHSSDLFTQAAREFLDRRDPDRPFFLYTAFMAPHDPRETHEKFHDLYDPEAIELEANFMPEHPFDSGNLRGRDEELAALPRTPEETRRHIAEYYAMITHADAVIGEVIDDLKRRGLYENTIVVFAGDNGLALGRHGLFGKQNLYEHAVRVPLIFAGPGIPAGQTRDPLCYLIDVYPTLCDLLGLEIPETVEGRSLAPVLQDPDAPGREHLLLAYRHIHRAVREDRWKLIEYAVDGARHTQLFDLQNDPDELDNRAEDPACGDHLDRLRAKLRTWRTDWDDDRPGQGQDFWAGYDAGT